VPRDPSVRDAPLRMRILHRMRRKAIAMAGWGQHLLPLLYFEEPSQEWLCYLAAPCWFWGAVGELGSARFACWTAGQPEMAVPLSLAERQSAI
jgi:hypothetical protein